MNFLSENATVISGNLDEKSLLCVEEDAGPQAATWGDLAVKLHTLGQERCKEEDTEVSMDIDSDGDSSSSDDASEDDCRPMSEYARASTPGPGGEEEFYPPGLDIIRTLEEPTDPSSTRTQSLAECFKKRRIGRLGMVSDDFSSEEEKMRRVEANVHALDQLAYSVKQSLKRMECQFSTFIPP